MAEQMSGETVFQRHPEVIGIEVSGEMVLLDSRSWTYLDFDDIGSRIWVLLNEPLTLPALVDKLTGEFDVDAAACRRDTEMFLQDLIKKGVVVTAATD
jgi:Coenzyme PQQ synthesis protein D (PqqD)